MCKHPSHHQVEKKTNSKHMSPTILTNNLRTWLIKYSNFIITGRNYPVSLQIDIIIIDRQGPPAGSQPDPTKLGLLL